MAEETENIEALEAKETSKKLPVGWLILFWGLIIWGVYYFITYTPSISGWSQEKAYQESITK
ncbi:MAG: cbb3-type cytochrome c oxidase N-terminal domain-containing protein [Nitrospirota bacterium]